VRSLAAAIRDDLAPAGGLQPAAIRMEPLADPSCQGSNLFAALVDGLKE
jgi:hypothetical protein